VGQLGEDFVDEAEVGGEVIDVDVFGEEAADVACRVKQAESVRLAGWDGSMRRRGHGVADGGQRAYLAHQRPEQRAWRSRH